MLPPSTGRISHFSFEKLQLVSMRGWQLVKEGSQEQSLPIENERKGLNN
jgi:hypothetical protein